MVLTWTVKKKEDRALYSADKRITAILMIALHRPSDSHASDSSPFRLCSRTYPTLPLLQCRFCSPDNKDRNSRRLQRRQQHLLDMDSAVDEDNTSSQSRHLRSQMSKESTSSSSSAFTDQPQDMEEEHPVAYLTDDSFDDTYKSESSFTSPSSSRNTPRNSRTKKTC